jgi:HlyD family secretion protein
MDGEVVDMETAQLSILARITATALAAASLLVFAYWGLTRDLGAAEVEDVDVAAGFHAVRVVRGDLRQTVVATGRIEPYARLEVKSQVPGLVRRVHAEKGERVALGDPLFELDTDRLEARVAGLEAALAMRRAEAQRDLVGRAALVRAERERDFARAKQLSAHGVVSSADLERAEHALRLAEVDLTDARADKAARRAAVQEAEGALRQARKDLEESLIRAPVDAILVERRVEIGSVVADVSAAGGSVLAILADDSSLRLVAEVDENEIAPVRVGQDADVTLDAFAGESFSGTVVKVMESGTVETNVSNFEIEIELPADPRIKLGMSADARVVVHEWSDALLVPNAAIERGAGGASVRVIDPAADDGARHVAIHEIWSDGFQTVVGDELSEGDRLLVAGEEARG